MSAEDDTINGYFIPKGAIIMPNIWCVVCVLTVSLHVLDFNVFKCQAHES